MPDPREAIYDVLKAKWQRAQDEAAAAANEQAWADYEAANARAAAAYEPSGRRQGVRSGP